MPYIRTVTKGGDTDVALHLRVIESLEGLRAAAPEWSRLLADAGGNIFLTPQWITSWFTALESAATPAVAVAEDDSGRWVGILPMARTTLPWGSVRLKLTDFAGAQVTTSDHLGLVATQAEADAVWECMRPWIVLRDGQWPDGRAGAGAGNAARLADARACARGCAVPGTPPHV